MSLLTKFYIFFASLFQFLTLSLAIRCYECTSVKFNFQFYVIVKIYGSYDWTCNQYVATTCGYGFFGCIKVATYDGGVDKLGNFIDDPSAVVSMVRGCNILPLGGVDACQQQVLFGYRIITCYCYSDYCNGSAGRRRTLKQISFLLIFSLFLSLFIKMV